MSLARDIDVWPEREAPAATPRPRQPAPTKDQIDAIADVQVLRDMDDAAAETITKIETDLEFGDGDDSWAARARGALSAYKVARSRIGKRIHRLTGGPAQNLQAQADLNAAKAARQDAHARLMEQQAQARQDRQENARIAAERHKVEQREKTERHRLSTLERLSWTGAFYQAAKDTLDADTVQRLIEAATAAQDEVLVAEAQP